MRSIVLIAHNLRSCHNIGSLLRTADGLGIQQVFLTGYTPYPQEEHDSRMPHISLKIHKQISKTALGAEQSVHWRHAAAIEPIIAELQADGYTVIALEQTPHSVPLSKLVPSDKVAILVGREVEGVEHEVIDRCDQAVEIPMFGKKESFNVVQAAAMCLYHCRFYE